MSDRPCYYVKGDRGERILIPNCFAGMMSNDKRLCTCDARKHRETVEKRIEALEREVRSLRRIITTASTPASAERTREI